MMNWAMEPLTKKPSIYARKIADSIDNPSGERGYAGGFLAGGVEGLGDVISSMTSPVSLAGAALGSPFVGRLGKGITSLGRVEEMMGRGINPNMLPPQMIEQGAESIYNAGRQMPKVMRSTEDIIYDIMRDPKKVKSSIGGDFNVAEMMAKLHSARGR